MKRPTVAYLEDLNSNLIMQTGSKVCLVFSGGFKGGAEVLMLEFYHLLKREGFSCEVILNGGGEVERYCEDMQIDFSSLDYRDFASWKWPFPFLIRVFQIFKNFSRSDAKIYFVEGKVLTQVFALAGKLAGVKVVSYVHFPPSPWEAKRVLYHLCHRVVLCCSALSDYLVGFVNPDQLVVVKNFVDSKEFSPVDRSDSEKYNPEIVRILLVGHLSEVKGQVIAIQALSLLRDQGHRVELVLAGADNSESQINIIKIKELIQSAGLEDNVKLLGKVSNMVDQYRESDIFLLPSSKEGLPLVVLEAMASGLPVVATAVDGTPEAVLDGETGFLLSNKPSADEIKQALEKLISDKELRVQMGRLGRQRAQHEFSRSKYESELLAVVSQGLKDSYGSQ